MSLQNSGVILNPILNPNGNPVQTPGGGFNFAGRGNPINLAQLGTSVLLPSDGTIAANGVVTLATALPRAIGPCWVWFPAGAVVGGQAGLYYVNFTSTTSGQVHTLYTDMVGVFNPYVPPAAVLVPAVGSGVGYTTLTAVDNTVWAVQLPGGLMGPSGLVEYLGIVETINNANGKIWRLRFGGTDVATITSTTIGYTCFQRLVTNQGLENSQLTPSAGVILLASSSAAANALSVNTSADVILSGTLRLANSADFVMFSSVSITIRPG